ncbi:MAG: ACT domain-containing protein [Oscillospiraceae bacterium]|nr:ACT domain-containing protein [Oscillospiraceae bacterium]
MSTDHFIGTEQLSVFVENKPGKLVEVTEVLAAAGIDLRALSIADTADFGVLRVIVDKPDSAFRALTDAGYIVKINKVLPVSIGDTPGSLAKALRVLADAGIEVEYLYAFVAHGKDSAYVIIRVEDNESAAAALEKAGIGIMSELI